MNFNTHIMHDKPSTKRRMILESQAAAQDTKSLSRSRGLEVTLKTVIEWIKAQEYDTYTEQELIKTVSRYPHSILPRYRELVKAQLSRIGKKRREENR